MSFHRWESVKTFICGLGHLDFKHIYALRCFKFWKSVYISPNVVLRTALSCVVNSQDFNQLCYLYGVSVMSMNFSELTCAVYEHFRANTMWFFFFLYWVHYCEVEVLVVVFVCLSVCLFFFNLCCRPILSSWRINVYIRDGKAAIHKIVMRLIKHSNNRCTTNLQKHGCISTIPINRIQQ